MQNFVVVIIGNDISRLLNRVLIIFNRRNLKIISINAFYNNRMSNYLINFKCSEDKIAQIIKQINKIIGVRSVFYDKM
jgi:acetolactate synthase regulatory subunit